ncbi:MAG: OmpH family outer membrane protein [Syntrophales bacterium]
MKKVAVWGVTFICLLMVLLVIVTAAPKEAVANKKAADIKLGVIDTAKIMRDSKAAKSARAIFLKDVEAKRGILAAKEKEVRLLEGELKKPETKLSPGERNSKNDNLAKEVKELKRLGSDLEEELKKKDVELTRKLIGEIRGIVNAFNKKENYSLIMDKSTVVASDDAIDITDKIMHIYDGKEK